LTVHRAVTEGTEPDDATLVAGVVAGSTESFAALYERHKAPLFHTALAMTRDRGTAEEILQEAFLRAYRHIARVELAPGASLRPWLHRILINLVYDWSARRRDTAGPLEGVIERLAAARDLSPERQTERREVARLVTDAIGRLPFKQRIVILLFYLHDMDLQEIAQVLNVPPGTVKSRLYYGRARLREEIEADVRLAASIELRYVSA
jgi:RNA polymerase sigma-70 factor (ECF subfamily)